MGALERVPVYSLATKCQTYRGSIPYKMDPKCRVSIKPEWRPIGDDKLMLLVPRGPAPLAVKVITEADYEDRVRIIRESAATEAKKRMMIGDLASKCRDAALNEQGKLLVPKDLADKAGLLPESDVMLVGRETYFEIWDKAVYDRLEEESQEDADEMDLGYLSF